MANRPRAKMPPSQRAKQFLPFAAVKGLDEAFAKKERELYPEQRTEVSEEIANGINARLVGLHKGDMATVTHFRDGEHLSTRGAVVLLDCANHVLRISNTKISFDDILNIDLEEVSI